MAEPANTVTEIATRYGFWELGRFSMAYHELFQESPSETLRHSRQNRSHRVEISESALRDGLLGLPIK
jgi:transcriptional regulator GlxA family with amidase domain